MGDIKNALHIPRESLVKRLTEVKHEHEKKRKEAEEAAAEKRAGLLAAVADLDDDQIANIFDRFVGSAVQAEAGVKTLQDWVEYVGKNDKYRTIPAEPTGIETGLDRTIRVLNLASDKEIEVASTDPVYSYL